MELNENTKGSMLRMRHHIENVPLKLSELDFRDQVDVSQDSLILNLLDDDCLQKVFGYLNLCDLTNVADVCVRFEEQSMKTFSTDFSKKSIKHIEWNQNLKSLPKFGSLIQSLEVDGDREIFCAVSYPKLEKLFNRKLFNSMRLKLWMR